MKLLRWTLAGASFYVMYKYAIGKKARGEDVFAAPDEEAAAPAPPKAKPARKPAAKEADAEKPAAKKPAAGKPRKTKATTAG